MQRVFPIGRQIFDTKTINNIVEQATGTKASVESDKKTMPEGLKSISLLSCGNSSEHLVNEHPMLTHICYNYLIVADEVTMVDIARVGCLQIDVQDTKSRSHYLVWCSGNLLQLKQFIVSSCNFESCNEISKELFKHLTGLGFRDLFSDYTTSTTQAGKFLMVEQ